MERTLDDHGWDGRGFRDEVDALAKNWWALVIRGVAGIIFGILAFVMPVATLAALVLLFGAYALVDGLFNVAAAAAGGRGARPWWALLLAGLIGIAAGLVTFLQPGLTALALVYLIAAWAVVIGVLEIVAAVRLRKEIRNEWLLGLSGVLAVVFGVFMIAAPGVGAVAMVLWIGAYALVYGAILVFLGLRLRGRRRAVRGDAVRRAA
jgi:uncharacterized membrane protein HdeD (DUF308 family)